MKTDLLKKLLDELGIKSIPEDSVRLAMKKAINNPLYWFCFRRNNFVGNIHHISAMLSVAYLVVLFFTGAFVSVAPFSGWFINNHIGLYLFLGLCVTGAITIISETILVKMVSWNRETWQYAPKLNDPFRKTFEMFESAVGYGSEYYKESIHLLERCINKTSFVYIKDRDQNYYCVNISAAI